MGNGEMGNGDVDRRRLELVNDVISITAVLMLFVSLHLIQLVGNKCVISYKNIVITQQHLYLYTMHSVVCSVFIVI